MNYNQYRISFTIISILLLMGVSSCIKTDDEKYPITPIPEGVKIGSTGNKDTYQYWTYYSLKNNQAVMVLDKASWDLGFSCLNDSLTIILNTANFMYAANSGKTDFDQVKSAAGLKMNFDASNGNPDSNAIGKWYRDSSGFVVSKREVYVIDRGVDIDGNSIGFRKIQILGFSNNEFKVRIANLNGTNDTMVSIPKENNKTFTGLSFNTLQALTIEPDRDDWDILLGQYTTMLFSDGEPYPYIVTGAVLNPKSVMALELNNTIFADFNAALFPNYTLSKAHDAIGYNWKTYSLSAGKYTMIDKLIYLVKGIDGANYKFRFLDFYDNNGNKGYPTFEYQKLL